LSEGSSASSQEATNVKKTKDERRKNKSEDYQEIVFLLAK